MPITFPSIPKPLVIQAAASLILALAAFFLFSHWATSLIDKNEILDVVVSARDLKAPINLVAEDLMVVKMRRERIPLTALVDPKDALGVTLIHPVSAGQFITTNELAGKRDPNSGGLGILADRKGFMLQQNWLAGPFPKLLAGNTVTIIASNQARTLEERTSWMIAEHVPVKEVVAGADGVLQRVFLVMDLQTSRVLLEARAVNAFIEVVVDGTDPLPKPE